MLLVLSAGAVFHVGRVKYWVFTETDMSLKTIAVRGCQTSGQTEAPKHCPAENLPFTGLSPLTLTSSVTKEIFTFHPVRQPVVDS